MNSNVWHKSHLTALMWVAPCIVAWSQIPGLAGNTGGLNSHQYLFASSFVSAITLTICAIVAGRARTIRTYFSPTDMPRLTALALLGAFGYYALLYAAYAPCPGQKCPDKPLVLIVAQYTWPAFGVAWSAILMRDHFGLRTIMSLGVGIVAVWVGASTSVAAGDAIEKVPFVLLAAVMFGLYSTLVKKFDYEPLSSLAWTFGAATVMSCGAMTATSAQPGEPGWAALRSVLINGTVVNGVSYVWWQQALRAAPMTFVAPWVSLTPLLAALFASQDSPPGTHWTGIALVLLSVLIATLPVGALGRSRHRTASSVVQV
jgi:drug/metabolite transporter (DMT)-like permease